MTTKRFRVVLDIELDPDVWSASWPYGGHQSVAEQVSDYVLAQVEDIGVFGSGAVPATVLLVGQEAA